ncbi:MAG: response regulator [Myxococcales bacterium]
MSELYNSLQSVFTGHIERKRLPSAPKNTRSRRGKVLVVDDNRVNQFVAAEQLQELGYLVDVADDGAQALEKVRAQDYSVVLMDCQMPVMDGYTATREIRQIEQTTGKHQLIIALTAHAMTGERERVMAAGMDDYLSKPLRGNALERMLARYGRDGDGQSDPPAADERADASATVPNIAILPTSHEPSNDVASGAARGAQPALDPGVRRSVELLRMCLLEMPTQVNDVIGAIEAADTKALRAAAHKLKGAALALAASPLANVAERLQHSAEAGNLNECVDLTCSLQTEFEELHAALSRELSPTSLVGE